MTDFVSKVLEFNQVAGTTGERFDVRKTALYMGLVLEEVAEMINPLMKYDGSLIGLHDTIVNYSTRFKNGTHDVAVANMSDDDREEALDAFVDIAVVAIGGGVGVGADVVGATHEVADNNLSKFPVINRTRTALKDENGKVKKPDGYKPPELRKYLR